MRTSKTTKKVTVLVVLFSQINRLLMKVKITMQKIQLTLDDSRRLTGKNLLWDQPGAIIDAYIDGIDKLELIHVWQAYVTQLLGRVGWQDQQTCYRIFNNGVNLAISAPLDGLYAAVDLNDIAWRMVELHYGQPTTPFDDDLDTSDDKFNLEMKVAALILAIKAESSVELLTLISLADQKNTPYLVDDETFSLGFGASTQIWPLTQLPLPADVQWQKYQRVPSVYVTGTNGKSTTVRLLSKMFSKAAYCCGVTSTDFIKVGDNIIDTGDYSGPSGARMLLREKALEAAVLEVARGGLLRRGLPIADVDAAIITNVAEDHLGQYGINDLAGLTATKFMVAKGLSNNKPLILNADDSNILRHFKANQDQLSTTICWFSLDENNPTLVSHRQLDGSNCFVRNHRLIYQSASEESDIIGINEIPMTLKGAALHNVRNALGAIATAKNTGLKHDAIKAALLEFKSDANDNPGRGNLYTIKGATVIVDFAHNVHSMDAMATTLNAMPAKRKLLMLGHAGDRSDSEITNLTRSILNISPDRLVITETPEYLRGRELGDIPSIIRQTALEHGLTLAQLEYSDSPLAGAKQAISNLEEGDLIFLMVLSQRDKIDAYLKKQIH